MRNNITLECTECHSRKYCKFCRKHTPHKETK